ncbi:MULTISPECIES: hypothetical protein [Mucilaginibacter]|uniref:hypothetical protein n=1 Tax=Mucilaginibacter TaxID=423349 RepID=UPI0001E9D8C5|nr:MULTISPECIES: hypothetical protein [Mucilaginibacter]
MIPIKSIIKSVVIIAVFHLSAYGQNSTDTTKHNTVATVSNEEKEEEYRLHNDWANLKYYQDDNKKLGTDKKDLVLLIGDSIT